MYLSIRVRTAPHVSVKVGLGPVLVYCTDCTPAAVSGL